MKIYFLSWVYLSFGGVIGAAELNIGQPKQSGEPSEYKLNDFTSQERKILRSYGVPVDNSAEFESFLTHLRAGHEKSAETGQVSMVWEYLLTAVKSLPTELRMNKWIKAFIFQGVNITEQLAAGKYSISELKAVYRQAQPPEGLLPKDLIAFLDRRVDELKNIRGMEPNIATTHLKRSFMTDRYMVHVFLEAIKNDSDKLRKKRLRELIKSRMGSTPHESVSDIEQVVQELLIEASEHEIRLMTFDDYSFEGDPLRTGTDFIYTAALRELVRVDGDSLLPEKIRRILVIGPGVSMVVVDDLKNPRQMIEPFALLDILLESQKIDLSNLQIHLLDISQDVSEHVQYLKAAAKQNKPISLALGLKHSQKKSPIFSEHFRELGRSIQGAVITEDLAITSFYQARKKIQIPSEIVLKLRMIEGDMTTTNFSHLESYDLIICFNTLVYLNEKERALAGVGIRKALSQNGCFIANNGLSKKSDPTIELLGNDYLSLIQKKVYKDYPPESVRALPPAMKGSQLWVYKKGS